MLHCFSSRPSRKYNEVLTTILLHIYNYAILNTSLYLQSNKVHESMYIFIDTGTLIIHSNYQKHINDTDNEHTIMIT